MPVAAIMTVHQLRRQWKPQKLRLQSKKPNHPTAIRFHRACSWLDHAQKQVLPPDLLLIVQWIAFNALYAQGDDENGDIQSWKVFLEHILEIDSDGVLGKCLRDNRPLVLDIVSDQYLSGFFWRSIGRRNPFDAASERAKCTNLLNRSDWHRVLHELIHRIYLLRCQMAHGAATFGSELNRTALKRCTRMLEHLLPAILLVWSKHGADEDWGPIPYPPLQPKHLAVVGQ
jgi:hypothetical protein